MAQPISVYPETPGQFCGRGRPITVKKGAGPPSDCLFGQVWIAFDMFLNDDQPATVASSLVGRMNCSSELNWVGRSPRQETLPLAVRGSFCHANRFGRGFGSRPPEAWTSVMGTRAHRVGRSHYQIEFGRSTGSGQWVHPAPSRCIRLPRSRPAPPAIDGR
jgi:hypothetical protein